MAHGARRGTSVPRLTTQVRARFPGRRISRGAQDVDPWLSLGLFAFLTGAHRGQHGAGAPGPKRQGGRAALLTELEWKPIVPSLLTSRWILVDVFVPCENARGRSPGRVSECPSRMDLANGIHPRHTRERAQRTGLSMRHPQQHLPSPGRTRWKARNRPVEAHRPSRPKLQHWPAVQGLGKVTWEA